MRRAVGHSGGNCKLRRYTADRGHRTLGNYVPRVITWRSFRGVMAVGVGFVPFLIFGSESDLRSCEAT